MTPFAPPTWLDSPAHLRRLEDEAARILRFARTSIVPGGFAWQDARGRPMPGRTPQLFLTARMAHAASLGVLRGVPGSGRLLDHAVACLLGPFADDRHGGWYSNPEAPDGRKATYEHVHVVLGATSACVAGHPDGPRLLERGLEIVESRLWSEDEGALRESYAADWSDDEGYRGANANMHGLEAFLAAGDVTGDRVWHDRGLRIARRVVGDRARRHDWLLPEHFDPEWNELLDYNRDEPNHPFRPFGATYGHSLEWARYLVGLHASPVLDADPWLVEAASGLARRALEGGWGADGREGLVYTVDWEGRPVSRLRLHWPICEGIQATAALARATGEDLWVAWYRRLWDHAEIYFVDDSGAWINELDDDLRESGTVWPGRPDVYHAIGACVVPSVGLTPCTSLATAGLASRLAGPGGDRTAPAQACR